MSILETLQANANATPAAIERSELDSCSALETLGPCSPTTGGIQDLDVLPVLYDDPDYNFWHFLNLSPPPQSPNKNDL